ncbi:TlpA family protein disulfide reductase [Halorussus halobius]|uniref:TlpA family protein disulfide reductase n=1 Tax=Halorussus halobius TaxID=1710537 RepID=UPI001B2FEEC9|nr:TlpA disulfide reductase family protein [Halorussus halobius]
MRRRDLLASVATATTMAAAGCNSLGESLARDDGGDAGPVTGETESVARDAGPVTVETLDAPGSEAGRTTVPEPGRVTFVEFFATTCGVCASQMSVVGEAHERVDDDVQFLSVTSEPVGLTVSADDVAAWWADHGGTWPVATDDGTELARAYDATSVPTAVVVAPDGTETWSHAGPTTAATIADEIRAARGGESA